MKRRKPPNIATWFLNCFVGENEALVGDLAEEYRAGRSRIWYWKEVLIAILRATGNDLRVDWILSLRAAALFLAIDWFFFHWIQPTLWNLYGKLHVPPLGLPNWIYPWIVVDCVFFSFFGYVVSRLHRRSRAAIAILSSALVLFANVPNLYRLAQDLMGNGRYRPYFYAELVYTGLLCFSTLLGGLWTTSRHSEQLPSVVAE